MRKTNPRPRTHNGFRAGETVYACECCGRRTRNTGAQAISSRTCPECWELAGLVNQVLDYPEDLPGIVEQRDALVAVAVSKGGCRAKILRAFKELWSPAQ